MPVKHRRNRAIELPDGDCVTSCEGCRDAEDPKERGWIVRGSWLRQCADCHLDMCCQCMPEGETVCGGCRHAQDSLAVPAVEQLDFALTL